MWLYTHNPGLMQERTRLSTSDQQGWDKILFPLMEIFFIVWLIFISLDAVRFHWSSVPLWLQMVGTLVLLCSFYFLFRTFVKTPICRQWYAFRKSAGIQWFPGPLSLCTASNVYGNSSVYRGNVLIARLLVWANFCDHLHDHSRTAGSARGAHAACRTARILILYGSGEISFHTLYLVIGRRSYSSDKILHLTYHLMIEL